MSAYSVAYHSGDVKASWEPNSRFWTKPVPAFSVGDISHTSDEDTLWELFGDEGKVAQEQLTDTFSKLKV